MSGFESQPSVVEQLHAAAHAPATDPESIYALVRHELVPHYRALARCRSTAELHADPLFIRLEPAIARVLETPEVGCFATAPAPERSRYRFIAWNLERGIELEGQIEALRLHPFLRSGDVLLLTETDVGMARSANCAVAQRLAEALGMYYAFVPCYLNLSKGAGTEREAAGENLLGLHGNALLSRYPLENVRAIVLRNGKDKMAGREKRIGSQRAVVADVVFPNGRLPVASVHLDAQSTQHHRCQQMETILGELGDLGPAVIGGDWNTNTYNSSRAFHAIMGFWLRVFMGVDRVIRYHYLHPNRFFERKLFTLLEDAGYDYRACNVLGERTIFYNVTDGKTRKNLGEWVPRWCFAFIRWALRNHRGGCPLKLDWFATRQVRAENPVVIHDLRNGRGLALSDHDPIGVDIAI